jgi:hypothetical protein
VKRSPPAAGSAPIARRHAAIAEDAEMADERLEPAAIAGRADDRVRLDALAVLEARAGRIERLDSAHDLDP